MTTIQAIRLCLNRNKRHQARLPRKVIAAFEHELAQQPPKRNPRTCRHLEGVWVDQETSKFRCFGCGKEFHTDELETVQRYIIEPKKGEEE